MNRYVSRSKAIWFDDDSDQPSITATTLIEKDDDDDEFTGLLDEYGNPIFRTRDRFPIGFTS